ncbi:MAG: AgmX/PglI C-terminal domain-containing protein [Bacteriovoracaceae bacterium]
MKDSLKTGYKLTSYSSGKVVHEFVLEKRKLIIGRSEKCDLQVDDDRISHYHAFIEILDEGIRIIDLSSINGTYINGDKIESAFVTFGDQISFGGLEFQTTEIMGESLEVEDSDENQVRKVDAAELTAFTPRLTPAEGLVVIDGEYCDINFDESEFKIESEVEAFTRNLSKEDYVDAFDERQIKPILKEANGKAIRVTMLTMGNILSVDYLPLKANSTYFMSQSRSDKKTVLIPTLSTTERVPFIKIAGDQITVIKPEHFEYFDDAKNESFKAYDCENIPYQEGQPLHFIMGTVEIRIETVDAPDSLKKATFFDHDKKLHKEAAKVFSAVLSILLLLLFVDLPEPEEEEKKIAVIYRQKIQNKKTTEPKFSKEVAKENEKVGQKKVEQPKADKKPQFAKKNRTPVKTQKSPQKKVAKKQAKKSPKKTSSRRNKRVAKKPMKTYKLKLDRSVASFLTSKNNLKSPTVENSASASSIGSSSVKVSDGKVSTQSNINMGTFGQDYKGKLATSTGTKGLSRKKGFDTTYVEPKTVVLGSMDPELLRKILREYLPQFRHCYQKELEHHSDEISGVLDLGFRINPNGAATKVSIRAKDSQFSRRGTKCMSSVLKLIKFPKPKGGGVVDVKQPLNFSSERGKI